jgi:hypothetical protein
MLFDFFCNRNKVCVPDGSFPMYTQTFFVLFLSLHITLNLSLLMRYIDGINFQISYPVFLRKPNSPFFAFLLVYPYPFP